MIEPTTFPLPPPEPWMPTREEVEAANVLYLWEWETRREQQSTTKGVTRMTDVETIDAQRPTLFGYPVEIALKMSDTETVDLTHALLFDGTKVTLDLNLVHRALNGAQTRGFGLSIGKGEGHTQ